MDVHNLGEIGHWGAIHEFMEWKCFWILSCQNGMYCRIFVHSTAQPKVAFVHLVSRASHQYNGKSYVHLNQKLEVVHQLVHWRKPLSTAHVQCTSPIYSIADQGGNFLLKAINKYIFIKPNDAITA